MSDFSWLEKIKYWLGDLGFKLFLWSIKMTQDEYLNTVCESNDNKKGRK